jgi:hypothetical protein
VGSLCGGSFILRFFVCLKNFFIYVGWVLTGCTLPLVFTVLGQELAIKTIQKSLDGERNHHAWIFSGPRGVGKYRAAKEFANIILRDLGGVGPHPDLHIIKKEDVAWSNNPSLQRKKQTNIPLDLLRERIIGGRTSDDKTHDAIAFKTPTCGNKKVFIIDEAELLDGVGQNALLKTLEEPPGGTTIVLVTSRDDLLLPPVHSRCNVVSFSPLSPGAMRTWSEAANLGVTPADLSWAIGFSNGSPGLVCEAIESDLPRLAHSLNSFLLLKNKDYFSVSQKLLLFADVFVTNKLKQNGSASKEAANRRAGELVLLMFGSSAQKLTRGGFVEEGASASGVLVDIERQFSTNISIKVLLESLAARWAHSCVGDSAFM